MQSTRIFERSAKYLIAATRGGPMRAMIMRSLLQKPQNPNQLAEKFGVDYKTITHHIGVLLKMHWVTTNSQKYNELFFPTFTVEEKVVFEKISREVGKKL